MKRLKAIFVVVSVVAVAMVPASGFSASDDETRQAEKDQEFREKQWNDGVSEIDNGLDQLDAFDESILEDKPKSARKHLTKVLNHFEKALTHFEKAEVGKEHQGAIDDIDAGVKAINKALDDIDDGNMDAAQSQLDKANSHFNQAAEALG